MMWPFTRSNGHSAVKEEFVQGTRTLVDSTGDPQPINQNLKATGLYEQVPAVFACADLISKAFSIPDLTYLRAGSSEHYRNSRSERLLSRPGDGRTTTQILQTIELDLCLYGVGYLRYDERASTLEVIPPPDLLVERTPPGSRNITGYTDFLDGKRRDTVPNDMMTISRPSPGLPTGNLPPATHAAQGSRLAMAYNRNFFANSARPDFLMLLTQTLTRAEQEDFYTKWEERYRGESKAHRPALANFVKEVINLSRSQQDMQFDSYIQWTFQEVARAFHVPPPLVGDFSDASLNNVRVAQQYFWTNNIIPELKLVAEHLTRFFSTRMSEPELVIDFDLTRIDQLYEQDIERRRADMLDVQNGIITINEVRARRHFPPVAWGDVPPPRFTSGGRNVG